MTSSLNWEVKKFTELSIDNLYDALKLRCDVFIVEQTCFYPDIDNVDRHPDTLHLFCYQQDEMSAYLRILPEGTTYPDFISIGRVLTAPKARGQGLGNHLMVEALRICQQVYPDQAIKISAQLYLEKFYQRHGFKTMSAMYLEDDIEHVAMLKT